MNVQPGVVEQGKVAELRIELPGLRPGPAPRRLGLRGAGVQLLDSRLVAMTGRESRWLAHARFDGPLGPLRLLLGAVYADGEAVEVEVPLTVVPAPHPSPTTFPWVAVVIGSLLAAGVSVALIRLARRKAW